MLTWTVRLPQLLLLLVPAALSCCESLSSSSPKETCSTKTRADWLDFNIELPTLCDALLLCVAYHFYHMQGLYCLLSYYLILQLQAVGLTAALHCCAAPNTDSSSSSAAEPLLLADYLPSGRWPTADPDAAPRMPTHTNVCVLYDQARCSVMLSTALLLQRHYCWSNCETCNDADCVTGRV